MRKLSPKAATWSKREILGLKKNFFFEFFCLVEYEVIEKSSLKFVQKRKDKIGLPALTRKLRLLDNCLGKTRAAPELNSGGNR